MVKKYVAVLLLTTAVLTGCQIAPREQLPTFGEYISSAPADQVVSSGKKPEPSVEEQPENSKTPAAQNTAPAASQPEASVEKYALDIPEGFSKMEVEGLVFYYAAEDDSCINLNIQPKDPDFSSVSAQSLKDALTLAFSENYKEDIVITDNYFTQNPVSGYPAYQYSFTYTLGDNTCTQLLVGVDADQTYTFGFTDTTGSWTEHLEKSAASVSLVTE